MNFLKESHVLHMNKMQTESQYFEYIWIALKNSVLSSVNERTFNENGMWVYKNGEVWIDSNPTEIFPVWEKAEWKLLSFQMK